MRRDTEKAGKDTAVETTAAATTTAATATGHKMPGEARAWLARTLLFEAVMEGLRHGGTVIGGDRTWRLTSPERGEQQDPAAA